MFCKAFFFLEIGGRKSEDGNRKSEDGNRKSEDGNRKSEDREIPCDGQLAAPAMGNLAMGKGGNWLRQQSLQ